MSRSNNRAGYGVLRGATNPKVTVSTGSPSYPKIGDIWIDTTGNLYKYWSGTAWISVGGGSTFDPGIYGTVGTPLTVILSLALSNLSGATSGITATILSELTTDLEQTQTQSVSVSDFSGASSGISAPTITVQLL